MIYPSDVMALIDLLDAMNPTQRKLLMDKYCHVCGEIKDQDAEMCMGCDADSVACPV